MSDDDAMSWMLKHSSDADLRNAALALGVRYPVDVDIVATTCHGGQPFIGVWAINFTRTPSHWNITVDGEGYAGASVRPRAEGLGAINMPAGKHTVAFVNPTTGAVIASKAVDLTCGSNPVTMKPSAPAAPMKPGTHHSTAKPSTKPVAPAKPAVPARRAKPATSTSTKATGRVTSGVTPKTVTVGKAQGVTAVTDPTVVKPATHPASSRVAASAPAPSVTPIRVGPTVQTDRVAQPASGLGVTAALLGGLAGIAAFGVRRLLGRRP